MGPEAIHDLTSAYALDALDAGEAHEFEEHMRHCAQCQSELADLQEVTAVLAYAAPPAAAAPTLRGRILEQARAERSNVIPFPRAQAQARRRTTWILGAAAAAAAAVAIGLGIWAATLNGSLSHERNARASDEAALAVLADPAARRVPLSGRPGVLAVRSDGTAALAVSSLGRAPSGKTYEAWVVQGMTPSPAGLFHGENGRPTLVALRLRVPRGSAVAVTVERSGGVSQPTTKPILSASA